MGYSARYHVASLAAVFLALAAGILIGSEFGADVLTDATEDLEQSLSGDLNDARERIAELENDLDRQERFASAVLPALTGDTLTGLEVGVVAFGSRPESVREEILEAMRGTGGDVAQLAVVREPPRLGDLVELVNRSTGGRRAAIRRIGRSIAAGSGLYERSQDSLLSSFSGEVTPLDAVIVTREQPADVDGGKAERATDLLEDELLEGLMRTAVPVVGVEQRDAEPSSVGLFADHGLTIVDHLDLVAGQLSLVLALDGARGHFGVSERADAFVPDLLSPAGA